MTAGYVLTLKRFRAAQCASMFCKKPGWMLVQMAGESTFLCRKHYMAWASKLAPADGNGKAEP